MKMKIGFLALLLAAGTLAMAQGGKSEVSFLKVSDFSIYLSGQGFKVPSTSLSQARVLAPASDLLNRDYSDFNSHGYTAAGFGSFEAMLSFRIRNKEKSGYGNSSLRLGLGYSTGSSFSSGFFDEERKPYDTLTSSQTGNQVFVDSITQRSLYVNYYSDYVKLDVAYILRTGGDSHWSLYGGFGVRGSLGFNGFTSVEYFENGYYSHGSGEGETTSEREEFREGNSFGGAFYIPLGVDVRFGKTNDFWKRIHLFAEARPGLDFHKIPNLDLETKAFIQGGVGVRVTM